MNKQKLTIEVHTNFWYKIPTDTIPRKVFAIDKMGLKP